MPLPKEFEELVGKRCLVTGAAGFIGGALFHRLAEYGIDVAGTVLYPEEANALKEAGYKCEVLDLASNDSWDDLLRNIDIVFHIAAMFQEVEHGREMYERVNRDGALKLAETAAKKGVERFIHCSTVGVLGNVKEIPATEETPFNPMDIYHETKLAGELAILEFARHLPADGMRVTVNRPAMVYGPGDLRMMKLFKAILSKKFIMIGNGETLAHLGYIDDQVDSFLLMAVAPGENVHLQTFNIASGQHITLNQMARYIAECGGVNLNNFHIPVFPVWLAGLLCEIICKPLKIKPPLFRRRVGFFVHNRAFDISKAKSLLGYNPKWSERDGIAETINWYRQKNFI